MLQLPNKQIQISQFHNIEKKNSIQHFGKNFIKIGDFDISEKSEFSEASFTSLDKFLLKNNSSKSV